MQLMNKEIRTPVSSSDLAGLHIGDLFYISGEVFCGRDAVLPRIVQMIRDSEIENIGVDLCGAVVFHTAVSLAGVGPTSSNKIEIENSMGPLAEAGVKIHLGKGAITGKTVRTLSQQNAVYAVIPPVTALLAERTLRQELVAFPELGMEALYRLNVDKYPAIVAAAHGRSIYES